MNYCNCDCLLQAIAFSPSFFSIFFHNALHLSLRNFLDSLNILNFFSSPVNHSAEKKMRRRLWNPVKF